MLDNGPYRQQDRTLRFNMVERDEIRSIAKQIAEEECERVSLKGEKTAVSLFFLFLFFVGWFGGSVCTVVKAQTAPSTTSPSPTQQAAPSGSVSSVHGPTCGSDECRRCVVAHMGIACRCAPKIGDGRCEM